MHFSKKNYTNVGLKEFTLYGSKAPTEKEPVPTVYKSNVFARNSVVAQSIFAKLMATQYKIKSTALVVLKCEEVKQDDDFVVKNYRIQFVYRTKTGLQNGYKEIRHVNRVCAVSTMFQEFGSRHKVQKHEISIVSVEAFDASEATKPKCLTYSAENLKFPVFKKIPNVKRDFVPVTQKIFN